MRKGTADCPRLRGQQFEHEPGMTRPKVRLTNDGGLCVLPSQERSNAYSSPNVGADETPAVRPTALTQVLPIRRLPDGAPYSTRLYSVSVRSKVSHPVMHKTRTG